MIVEEFVTNSDTDIKEPKRDDESCNVVGGHPG